MSLLGEPGHSREAKKVKKGVERTGSTVYLGEGRTPHGGGSRGRPGEGLMDGGRQGGREGVASPDFGG